MQQLGCNMTQTALFMKSLQCCKHPHLCIQLMASKVLHDIQSTVSHQAKVLF